MNYREMIVVDVDDIDEEVWRQFNTDVDTRYLFWPDHFGTGYKYLDFSEDEAKVVLGEDEIYINIDLHQGQAEAKASNHETHLEQEVF